MERQKINYQKQTDIIINNLANSRPSLLLHACCAPCSSYVIEYLSKYFAITIFYYNPNIYPSQEYERRLEELKKFLKNFSPAQEVHLIQSSYDPEDFYKATNVKEEKELQAEKEKGERCRRCYLFRMKKAYEYALDNNFDWFTTTLSISPFKDSEKINTIGQELEVEGKTKFLPSDFKKRSGFLRSLQLSAEYGLYRQDYCGCIYSKGNIVKS